MIMFITAILLQPLFHLLLFANEESLKIARIPQRMKTDVANSVIITGAWVFDNYDDMLFMMEFGATGDPIAREDVFMSLPVLKTMVTTFTGLLH